MQQLMSTLFGVAGISSASSSKESAQGAENETFSSVFAEVSESSTSRSQTKNTAKAFQEAPFAVIVDKVTEAVKGELNGDENQEVALLFSQINFAKDIKFDASAASNGESLPQVAEEDIGFPPQDDESLISTDIDFALLSRLSGIEEAELTYLSAEELSMLMAQIERDVVSVDVKNDTADTKIQRDVVSIDVKTDTADTKILSDDAESQTPSDASMKSALPERKNITAKTESSELLGGAVSDREEANLAAAMNSSQTAEGQRQNSDGIRSQQESRVEDIVNAGRAIKENIQSDDSVLSIGLNKDVAKESDVAISQKVEVNQGKFASTSLNVQSTFTSDIDAPTDVEDIAENTSRIPNEKLAMAGSFSLSESLAKQQSQSQSQSQSQQTDEVAMIRAENFDKTAVNLSKSVETLDTKLAAIPTMQAAILLKEADISIRSPFANKIDELSSLGEEKHHDSHLPSNLLNSQSLTAGPRSDIAQVNISLRQGLEQQSHMHDMIQRFSPVMRQQLLTMVSQGIQQAEIRLDPAELGHMTIRIQVQGDQTQVQFHVAQQQTRDLLEQAVPRLRELLAEQGMQLADSQISHGGAGRDQGAKGEEAHAAGHSKVELDEIAAEESRTQQNMATSYGSAIDYYA